MTEQDRAVVLKQDSRGRVVTPPADREAFLDRFEESGLSAAAFARHHGLRYQTFHTWVRNRRAKRRAEESFGGFSEVVVCQDQSPRPGKGLRVDLPGGASCVVQGAEDVVLVAQLLQALVRC
jgi:transposase-like protein